MSEHQWKVVRLSKGQLLDVRPEDIVAGGWFRTCETYRGGGGYDHFPALAKARWGIDYNRQFVVQLFGCHLDCWYCYVTREGVWGEYRKFSTTELINQFLDTSADVFHLMGGAPALQINYWPELIQKLTNKNDCAIFHSDILLTEKPYDFSILKQLNCPNCLYAVDIKGLTDKEHLQNTRKKLNLELFYNNLDLLERAEVPYYVTFTNVEDPDRFWQVFRQRFPDKYDQRKAQSFSIKVINYAAMKHVDDVPWGARA